MKKILFASTALVAAGLMTGTASASEKIKLELGGYSKWWVVGVWNDSSYEASGAGARDYNSVDVKGDNEIVFSGSTTLDNGLKVGVAIELEAGGNVDTTSTSSDVIDTSSVYVQGGFGKVIIGSLANGVNLLHVMAPDATGNLGDEGLITSGAALGAPAQVSTVTTTAINTDGDAEKITYVTPSFYGLTLGGSYIPNASEDTRGVTRATEIYGVTAVYDNSFGGVGVKLSTGYVEGDISHTTMDSSKRQEFSVGGQLSYAGFTVGGAYRDIKDNFSATLLSGAGAATGVTTDGTGHAWDAGVMYETGPYSVSLNTFQAQSEHTIATAGEDKFTVYQLGGKYNLGAGVDLVGLVGYAEYDDESNSTSTADANHNEGWVVATGLALTF